MNQITQAEKAFKKLSVSERYEIEILETKDHMDEVASTLSCTDVLRDLVYVAIKKDPAEAGELLKILSSVILTNHAKDLEVMNDYEYFEIIDHTMDFNKSIERINTEILAQKAKYKNINLKSV